MVLGWGKGNIKDRGGGKESKKGKGWRLTEEEKRKGKRWRKRKGGIEELLPACTRKEMKGGK